MGKELIALAAILLMTFTYFLNNSPGVWGSTAPSVCNQTPETTSHLEIVRNGSGRIYPLEEVRRNFIVASGAPLESGDLLEYTDSERPGHGVQLRRGRMKGQTLLLFGMTLNLNEATVDDLMALPGIGAKTAAIIVRFREENGPFKTISGLMAVRGIGRKKFAQIRGKLKI